MSTRLALGAIGALAGLSALGSRQGSRGWAPSTKDPEEIYARTRAFLESRRTDWDFRMRLHGDLGPLEEQRAILELRKAVGRGIVGLGSHRVVYTFTGAFDKRTVLKVAYWGGEEANRNEVRVWDLVSSHPELHDVVECLAPVVRHSGDGRWVVMARYDPDPKKWLSKPCERMVHDLGIRDLSDSNVGARETEDGRLIDYGMIHKPGMREALDARGVPLPAWLKGGAL